MLIRKLTRNIILSICCLVLMGGSFQYVNTKVDETAYPPPGDLVDVGGYKLHIHWSGQGSSTVVLDSGLGCNSLDWSLVQPEIAKFARVCSYDRAGYGWSDESPLKRTSENIVDELHTLLVNSGAVAPYILVGHSFGGVNARLYANKYPDEVAAVVLVDASHEDQITQINEWPQTLFFKLFTHPTVAPILASIGFNRLLNHLPEFKRAYSAFQPDIQQTYIASTSTVKFMRTITREICSFEESLKHLKTVGGYLGDKPLIVITAGIALSCEETGFPEHYIKKLAEIWDIDQKDLVTKSTSGKQLIAERSSHMITHHQPEIIIDAVKEIVSNLN